MLVNNIKQGQLFKGILVKINGARSFSVKGADFYAKERVVVLGSGWAGFRLAKDLDSSKFDITLVSPRNHFVFTPLLASTSVGTLEFRAITETIRSHQPKARYIEGQCQNIDFSKKTIKIQPVINSSEQKSFDLSFDKLVVAVGAITNTFNIKGVDTNALFLKNIADARKIRRRVIDCFELSALPNITEKEKIAFLNFAVVGGGPTGVELSAELHDFINEDLSRLYPSLMPYVKMTLYDVAPNILSSFDSKLSTYATKHFRREGIHIRTGTSITEVKPNSMSLSDGTEIPVGMVVWATGVTETGLVKSLADKVKKHRARLVVDPNLNLLSLENGKILDPSIYAIGDCASIEDNELACTAQVAEQQAIYLSKQFNKSPATPIPFVYHNKGIMAYLGGWSAIVQLSTDTGKIKQSGYLAWVLWRSAYMTKSVSWRNKLLIPVYWFCTWAFGRDVSRF